MLEKYRFDTSGLDKSEEKQAKKQFAQYRKNYDIEKLSDLHLLSELVFREVLQIRYKKKIEIISTSETVKQNNIIPKNIMDTLNNNLNYIITLKERLGLFQDKKIEDPFQKFKLLEKKFDIWKKDHVEERKTVCPFCKTIYFLNIRTDKYKESNLKLYENKVLCNKQLWKLYREKKITKEEFALVLNVSARYIDWLGKHIYKKLK